MVSRLYLINLSHRLYSKSKGTFTSEPEHERMLANEYERIFARYSATTVYIVRPFMFASLRYHINIRS